MNGRQRHHVHVSTANSRRQQFCVKPTRLEYLHGYQYRTPKMASDFKVNNSNPYQAACLAGLGIIQAPENSFKERWHKVGECCVAMLLRVCLFLICMQAFISFQNGRNVL